MQKEATGSPSKAHPTYAAAKMKSNVEKCDKCEFSKNFMNSHMVKEHKNFFSNAMLATTMREPRVI